MAVVLASAAAEAVTPAMIMPGGLKVDMKEDIHFVGRNCGEIVCPKTVLPDPQIWLFFGISGKESIRQGVCSGRPQLRNPPNPVEMARRGDDAGAAQNDAERVLSVHRSLFAHHSGHFRKKFSTFRDQRDQNRFSGNALPLSWPGIGNLEFMSPALYFVLMPEIMERQ